jgi:hypothetical protein
VHSGPTKSPVPVPLNNVLLGTFNQAQVNTSGLVCVHVTVKENLMRLSLYILPGTINQAQVFPSGLVCALK